MNSPSVSQMTKPTNEEEGPAIPAHTGCEGQIDLRVIVQEID